MPPKKSAIGGRNKQFIDNEKLRVIINAAKPQPYHKASDLDDATLENISFAEHIPTGTHLAITLCQHKNRKRLVSNVVLRRLFNKKNFVYNLGGTIVQSNPIVAATRFKNRMHVDNDPENELVCIYPDTLLEDFCPGVRLAGSPAKSLEEFFIACSTAANYSPPTPKQTRPRKPPARASPNKESTPKAKAVPPPPPKTTPSIPPNESKEFTGIARDAYRALMKMAGGMYQFVPDAPPEHAWNVDRVFPVSISNLGEIGSVKKGGDLSLSFEEGTVAFGLDDPDYNSSTLAVTPGRKIIYPSRSARFFGDATKFFGICSNNRKLIIDEVERGALRDTGKSVSRSTKTDTKQVRPAESTSKPSKPEEAKLKHTGNSSKDAPKDVPPRIGTDTTVNSPLLTLLMPTKSSSPVPQPVASVSDTKPSTVQVGNKRKRCQDDFVATLEELAAADTDPTAGEALDLMNVENHSIIFRRLLVPAYKRIREAVRRECLGQVLDEKAIDMAQEFLDSIE